MLGSRAHYLALLVLASACTLDAGERGNPPPDRKPGEHRARTAACDDLDPNRCVLPWPSNAFVRADTSTSTGLRLAVERSSLFFNDDPTPLARADGFSRNTPLATVFAGAIDPATLGSGDTLAVRLYEAEPGERWGRRVPLRAEIMRNGDESLLMAWPLRPLVASADHVVVVTDALTAVGGARPTVERATRIALGLDSATNAAEDAAKAHHAPLRTLLHDVGVAPEHVLRTWDFTTRSVDDATRRLASMRERSIAAAATAGVVIDVVKTDPLLIVEGRLTAMPAFSRRNEAWKLGTSGLPDVLGTSDVPFRVVIPPGTGDWPVVLFGHGTSGSFKDTAFDADLAAEGFGKVGATFWGWNDVEVIDTFVGFSKVFTGVELSTSRLAQGLADLAAVQASLTGPLGNALAAATLGETANPAAGRHPDMRQPFYAGGSLGGGMGLVHVLADGGIDSAVLNVPGAAWTHYLPDSELFTVLADGFSASYDSRLDLEIAIAMSTSNWDDIDGSLWVDAVRGKLPVFLLQQSMGDPILPNVGTDLLAASLHATQVGTVLSPILDLPRAASLENATGLTQYRVPNTGAADVHGFAARETPGGAAAREQIRTFLRTARAGTPRIEVPAECPDARCDFTQAP